MNIGYPQPAYNIGDSIYQSLRKSIITLELTPGQALNIKDIATQLEASRSPVRDALMKLAKEGLVDIIAQKGTYVSKIDLGRVEEERFLREALEEKVLREFCPIRTQSDLTRLGNSLRMQRECMDRKDFPALLDYDDEFHSIFFERTQKGMCWEIIRSMSGHYRRIRLMSFWESSILSNVITEHETMLATITDGDADALLRISKAHSSRLLTQEALFLERYPEYFAAAARPEPAGSPSIKE